MTTSYPGAIDSYTTKVDGVDDVMAAHVNNLQDAIVAIETPINIMVRRNTNQSIPNTTPTVQTYEEVIFESRPTGTPAQWNVAAPGRLTCYTPGRYLVIAHTAFDENQYGIRNITLIKNTTDVLTNTAQGIQYTPLHMQIIYIVHLDAGDYIRASVYQGSGSSLNIVPNTNGISISWALIK